MLSVKFSARHLANWNSWHKVLETKRLQLENPKQATHQMLIDHWLSLRQLKAAARS